MSVKVIRPGLLTTVQDLGRAGLQKYGVVFSGAMDSYALRVANLLVGNEEGDAALEVTLTGPELEIEEDVLIAVTGGDLSPTIQNEPIPLWKPVFVKKGSVLKFGPCQFGCRAYIAMGGGIDVDEVMGSRSTYLRAGIGGFQGRALKVNDSIKLNPPSEQAQHLINQLSTEENLPFSSATWSVNNVTYFQDQNHISIRVIRGSHYDLFTSECRGAIYEEVFKVTPQSDRMGYRLSGPTLTLSQPLEMVSEAVALGTIQVPPDGNPIILLADRQTTGGYPRIGQVLSVDIPLIAQLKPGDAIKFKEVTLKQAEELYLNRERELNELRAGLKLKSAR
ncbi:biotin-dependent carboxyltransferase family protein [Alkalihalobacterium alkalinitrilicum]|uniref:5-oxoprolinase subunit C family protein n=1 Tax=Alkalihalobacterium alkalinitrilicum TaxID=427920 RepID=UPI0009948F1C|nr:biotin-dependent carboxyltransferase family protein [Alkalihalobacterium alkalinitrilicum]